jgi:hypothetical protein
MKSVATNSVPFIQGSGLICFATSFAFGSALKNMIKMIGIIQVVNHIPLMNIDVPSNAVSFYRIIIPVVNYDMLSHFDFYEDFLIDISRSA